MSGPRTGGPRGWSARTVGRTLAVLAAGAVLASCAQVPHQGSVVEVRQRQQQPPPQDEYFFPKGPDRGERPADIVTGFLTAMTARPLNTKPAQEYLSAQALSEWDPRRVMTYQNNTLAHGVDRVVVRLEGADEVDARGRWQGAITPAAHRLVFPMVREDGEWRIARAPNALIVPKSFYDQLYQPANLYFFDPTGRILVPEPVHVPGGSQLASSLVRALVGGPGRSLSGVVRSYLPPGLSSVLSVPVNNGVAQVTLNSPHPAPLTRRATQLMLAQLTWTLRQDPTIQSFRLSIAGHPVTDSTGAQSFRVAIQNNDPHDPADNLASPLFFALRHGRLVSGQVDHPSAVDGPFGIEKLGIGPFAVSLDGNDVAAVAPDGLSMGPVGPVSTPATATTVLHGTGFLRPAWDFAGRVWVVQNSSRGARVVYLQEGRRHLVHVPGVTGQPVRRFLVSRDGSRLVAVIHGRSADRIVVSRLRYDAADVAKHGSRARRIPWSSHGSTRVRDIGWTSPTTIEVLDQLSPNQAEVRILGVDGSTSPDQTTSTPIPAHTLGLVTSPVGEQTPYAVLVHQLYDLGQGDATRNVSPPTIDTPGLRYVTYAG